MSNSANTETGWYTSASLTDQKIARTWIVKMLQMQQVTLEFAKADGSLRILNGTLNPELGVVWPEKSKTDSVKIDKSDQTCAVWDCDNKAWRSFRWDRLKKIKFDL